MMVSSKRRAVQKHYYDNAWTPNYSNSFLLCRQDGLTGDVHIRGNLFPRGSFVWRVRCRRASHTTRTTSIWVRSLVCLCKPSRWLYVLGLRVVLSLRELLVLWSLSLLLNSSLVTGCLPLR